MTDDYNRTKTDPDKVAILAADIYELVRDRNVLIAEGAMALLIAVQWQTTNCASAGCLCGEKALERAGRELREEVGIAASKLFDLELEARDTLPGEPS